MIALSPQREVFVAREITKEHESFYFGKINKVLNELTSQKYSLKGEFVIVIGGKLELEVPDFISKDQEMILKILLKNMKKNEALSLASKVFGINKNSIYKSLLKEK